MRSPKTPVGANEMRFSMQDDYDRSLWLSRN